LVLLLLLLPAACDGGRSAGLLVPLEVGIAQLGQPGGQVRVEELWELLEGVKELVERVSLWFRLR